MITLSYTIVVQIRCLCSPDIAVGKHLLFLVSGNQHQFLRILKQERKNTTSCACYGISGCRLLAPSYPASRACFCLLFDRGKEKEALLESRRSFELAAAQTSRLVNLVFSRQTGCF